MSAIPKAWLITGASSGLGLEMALAALRAGHRVIGTGRNIEKAGGQNPGFERLGGRWLEVDVSDQGAQAVIGKAIADEEARLGNEGIHWVVVNNAGNTLLGAVEDMSEGQISNYLQTNLFGFTRVWKAALPVLRRHRQGTLITISSIWGFVPKPEHMMYSASKSMTESLTESYAALLAPFGIRTIIIEPGGFRTPFPANHTMSDGGISEDYHDVIMAWRRVINAAGKDPSVVGGDPGRFGERVVEVVEERGYFKQLWRDHTPRNVLRVQLGSDCYGIFGERLQWLQSAYHSMAEVSMSTDAETS